MASDSSVIPAKKTIAFSTAFKEDHELVIYLSTLLIDIGKYTFMTVNIFYG
jgi:hypothetical protein